MQKPRVYVCGDVHLRQPDGVFMDFLQWLCQQPAARLVILGDLFEFWLETPARQRHYAALFARLQRLQRLGWRLDLIPGNREVVAGRRLAAASGAQLHWPACTVEQAGRRIRIVHGDRLVYDPVYHLSAAGLRGFWLQSTAMVMPPWMQDGLARLLRRSSRGSGHYPQQLPNTPRFFIDPRRVQAAARGCQALLAGHVHARVHCQLRGIEFALAGDWAQDRGSWLEILIDGRIRARQWPSVW
jgi:UDP-2,3-diacylglucosamine pyrophosphatase LpxH